MNRIIQHFFACLFLVTGLQTVFAQDTEEATTFEERTGGLLHMDGFFDLYWDEKKGRLLLQIDRIGEEFIYQSSMPRGVGSNDLGLDRGQLGDTRVVEFFRSGPKILMFENNMNFRASTENSAEKAAIESSFARSVLWGFEVLHESNGRLLVDATDFFLRDSHGITSRLINAQQGKFEPDESRSAIFLPRTRAFPDNTEIEAVVTFKGTQKVDEKGMIVSEILPSVIPDPNAFTVHLHHSFIRLPDDQFQPVAYDPRAGIIGTLWGEGFMDFGTSVGDPIKVIYSRRHRLDKKDPSAPVSEALEPIIYYVDPGAPEPIRSALIEGAAWWNQAFEAAGYRNAFQVRLLPEDADPMDVRYNVIQWVHRSTRGWSYGSSVVDPRTGEIIKGHVTLGSLRIRQDYLIAEGLLAPYAEGEDGVPGAMLEMALARIRQLSAHEVGHTIGMEHNFAASIDQRSSVMDYPFPLIRFDGNGGLDLSDAYGVGIGEWDKRTVLYAYQDFPEGADDAAERRKIMRETLDSGLRYIADQDARDVGTAHPDANLWDNGSDAIEELEHLLKVRSFALDNFSERNIRQGQPLATIEEVLVPLYLLHRFQIRSVGKLIGGQYFSYNLRGDGQSLPRTVDADRQQAAIDALLDALEPEVLAIPADLVALLSARPPGYGLTRESFDRDTGILFDPLGPAAAAYSLTLDVLLNLQRAARMNVFHSTDSNLPGFGMLLEEIMDSTWFSRRQSGMNGAIQRLGAYQVLHRLIAITRDNKAPSLVRAQAQMRLAELDAWLANETSARLDADWQAHYALARHDIGLALSDHAISEPVPPIPAPPGSPIGN